jgi:phage/plasmid-like protein (TIGR03299 family)
MSQETLENLNSQTLIGFTSRRGNAWHYRVELQGTEPNHYELAIPIEDVRRRLFNWTIERAPLTASLLTEDGVFEIPADEFISLVRSDTHGLLGIHSSKYQEHQYDEWLTKNIETLLSRELQVGSGGLLDGGKKAWVQIEMQDTMAATSSGAEAFQYRPFLTGATSCDGSIATTYFTGVQAVICDNTLSAGLMSAEDKVKIRHSSRSLSRVDEVRVALHLIEEVAETFDKQFDALASQFVSEQKWSEFVATITNPGQGASQRSRNMASKKVDELTRLWKFDERVAPWKNSAFGVVQAVNTWSTHVQSVRGATRSARNANTAITGGFDKIDADSLKVLASL